MRIPYWNSLSHREKYRLLQSLPGTDARVGPDVRERDIVLNGEFIRDIPSFYLSLGEAVNGPGGYFGKSLDALSDCFCGGFGVLPPARIHINPGEGVEAALDTRAWLLWELEFRVHSVESESTIEQLREWGVLEPLQIPEVGYLGEIISVCDERGVEVRIYD